MTDKDAAQLRAYLAEEPTAIIGRVGGCHEVLCRVLDRLDELEWIVKTLRAQPSPPITGTGDK